MLGAIVGDVVGSVYEWNNHRSKQADLFRTDRFFTDDTVLTIAVADAILREGDLRSMLRAYVHRFPDRGYGARFLQWASNPAAEAYNSFGNGSAMRASPAGWAASSLGEANALARWSAEVTHNHPEGIKGAQATASLVFLARTGASKDELREYVERTYAYDLSFSIDEIREKYEFNETCQETVPQAIVAFLESTDFEDAIRTAISVGGDSDTLACITGGIADAFYCGVPDRLATHVLEIIDPALKDVMDEFSSRYSKR